MSAAIDSELREELNAYLDGELDADARARFEAAAASDPAIQRELDAASAALRIVRDLPREEPPDRFLWLVQQRIRRRTRGRYFTWFKEPSVVLEAAVCAVLIFLTAALYLVGAVAPGASESPARVASERVILAPADRRFLQNFGNVELVTTSVTGNSLEVRLTVPNHAFDEFRREARQSSRLEIDQTSVYREDGQVWLTVRAPAGPRTDLP